MGHSRRVKPPQVMGMSGGSGEREASAASRMKRRDFARLRSSPTKGSSLSIIWSAATRSPEEPTRVPSSMYHASKARPGTTTLICSTTG